MQKAMGAPTIAMSVADSGETERASRAKNQIPAPGSNKYRAANSEKNVTRCAVVGGGCEWKRMLLCRTSPVASSTSIVTLPGVYGWPATTRHRRRMGGGHQTRFAATTSLHRHPERNASVLAMLMASISVMLQSASSGLTDIRPKRSLAWRGAVWSGASHRHQFGLVPPSMQ